MSVPHSNYDIQVHHTMHPARKDLAYTIDPRRSHAKQSPAPVHHSSQPAPHGPAEMLSGPLLEDAVIQNATKKIHNPVDKMFFMGFIAGIWVGFGGLAAISAAGGVPEDVRKRWVVLPKLLLGSFFAFALHLIILFGGELFTGNTMILTVGAYNKVVPMKLLAINWVVVYIGNWAGCLVSAYFFGYLTEIFASESYRSFLASITLSKLEEHGWGVLFLKAIPANAMVCMAVMLGLSARDSAGKIMGLWFPVVMFVLCGFEHCVANMFFTSIGLMYGAPSTVRRQWFNQSAAIPGNLIGGAVVIGLAEYLMNHWRSPFPFLSLYHEKSGSSAHDLESARRTKGAQDARPADFVKLRELNHGESHYTADESRKGGESSRESVDGGAALPHYPYHVGYHLNTPRNEEILEERDAVHAQPRSKGYGAWDAR